MNDKLKKVKELLDLLFFYLKKIRKDDELSEIIGNIKSLIK